MSNFEEQEMDVNNDNLVKKVGEGSISTVYKLQNAN